MAAFAQFASDLDEATRKQLERGKRVTELMKQKQYSPLSIADMAISLFAVNEGFLDDVGVEKIVDFEAALHAWFKSEQADLFKTINDSADYTDEVEAGMRKALEQFKSTQAW